MDREYTEDEMRDMGIAQEEIAAILASREDQDVDDDEVDADEETDEEDAGEESGEDADADADADADDADNDGAAAAEATAQEADAAQSLTQAAGDQSHDDDPVEDSGRFRPRYVQPLKLQDGSDASEPWLRARVEQIDDAMDDLDTKGLSGEITPEELRQQRKQLRAEREMISTHLSEHRSAQRRNADLWQDAGDAFFGTDTGKLFSGNRRRMAALNDAISEISQSKDAAGKSFSWLYERAGRVAAKDLGLLPAPAQDKPNVGKPKLRAVSGTGKSVTTLANVPAAAANTAKATDPFAYIDRLSGEAQEMAIAKLSEGQREKYYRGSR